METKKKEKNLGYSLTKQERNQRNMPCVMGTRGVKKKKQNKTRDSHLQLTRNVRATFQ